MPTQSQPRPLTESDRSWYGAQVRELLPDLYGRALRLCGGTADAEDLVAEAVARGWQALSTLQDREALRSWIFRILNNAYLSRRRAAGADAEHLSVDTVAEGLSLFDRLHPPVLLWRASPEQEFLNRLLREDLATAIHALPEVFRQVVVLVEVQGLTYREAADLLEVPVGTVRSRLARGRERLQEALREHGVDAGLIPASRKDPRHPEAG